ncbi:MAG: hypothetical protein ACLUHL_07225 [Dysosmobacter welbionis]
MDIRPMACGRLMLPWGCLHGADRQRMVWAVAAVVVTADLRPAAVGEA